MRPDETRDIHTGTALAVSSLVSCQFGAAFAATLFPAVGPVGAVSLRLVGAAVVLVGLTRPWRLQWGRGGLLNAAVFGLVIMGMNTCLYEAIDRLPLATGVTLEFLGPLTVAVATATSGRQRIWVVPAALGVALLGGTLHLSDLVGVAFALLAATGWAGYILMSRRVGGAATGLAGLCVASVLGAVVMGPIGAVTAGPALWRPGTLGLGLAVGVMCSAVPYSFDLLALRRLPIAAFGVLTSLNPAVAALAGWLILGDQLPTTAFVGIGCVIVASAGTTLARPSGRLAAEVPATAG
jgi:inner membrane transporter RhtA